MRGETPLSPAGIVRAKAEEMKLLTYASLLSLSTIALLSPLSARAADPTADNSGNNASDANANALTPQAQSNHSADIKITRSIRRALVKDSSLSVYAHNLKIITTQDHMVYLRGTVASSDDVGKILSLAQQHSGGYPVKNELSITSK